MSTPSVVHSPVVHSSGVQSDLSPSAPLPPWRLGMPPGRPAVRGAEAVEAEVDERFFARQQSGRSELPDPEPLATNLARCIVEILAGAREIEQIARWVTDDVYRHVLKRVVLAARARHAHAAAPVRPVFAIGSVRIAEPSDGVVEAVVIVHGRTRSRAVALRLEGLDRRWRATALHVL